jgi:hypothetical protein
MMGRLLQAIFRNSPHNVISFELIQIDSINPTISAGPTVPVKHHETEAGRPLETSALPIVA